MRRPRHRRAFWSGSPGDAGRLGGEGVPEKDVRGRLRTSAGGRPGEIQGRDTLSLDLFWIKDKSLTDTDSLPPPDVIATEIADDLEAALEQFMKIAARLGSKV